MFWFRDYPQLARIETRQTYTNELLISLSRKVRLMADELKALQDSVAKLQGEAGQNVQPGRPHIRGHGQERGGMCTPAQLEFIVGLCAKVQWRVSPESFVRSRLLPPLRRASWSGGWLRRRFSGARPGAGVQESGCAGGGFGARAQ